MVASAVVSLVGNITDDPDLRFTPSGAAVADLNLAVNDRVKDSTTGEWRDGAPLFVRCIFWGQQAENVAESLHKGDRVVVVGKLSMRTYDSKDEPPRKVTVFEVIDAEVGASMKWATATVRRSRRTSSTTSDPLDDALAALTPAMAGSAPPF